MNPWRPSVFCALSLASLAAGQGVGQRASESAFRQRLLDTVALWDGGLNGQSGMGAYRADWDGLFRSDLSRDFRQASPNADQTVISQSRAIYINAEACRASSGLERERFRAIVQRGADYLIDHAWDPVYGGVFWGLDGFGSTSTSSFDTTKQAYGQVHVVFSLCHAYSVTGDPAHLDFAWQVFEQFEERHADPDFPGAYRPSMNRSYSVELSDNNFDYMLHYFEALLALFDVTRGPRHERARQTLGVLGSFIVDTLVRDHGSEEAFVSYWYGVDWGLHARAYSPSNYWTPARFATSGHGVELAWLLSRAVERGFDPAWLATGRKLLNFTRRRAINANAGALVYDRLDTGGGAIPGEINESGLIWWTHAEAARTLAHWSQLRAADEWSLFGRIVSFVDQRFVDPLHGGWFEALRVANPSLTSFALDTQPAAPEVKGHVWKVSYHEVMFYAEILRLFQLEDPERAYALAFTDYERERDPEATSASGDFDGDGSSNLLEYATGSDARSALETAYRLLWDMEAQLIGLEYSLSETALGVAVEPVWSSDLRNWSEQGLAPERLADDGQRSARRVWRSASAEDGAVFLRLRVRYPR